jgi:hypothetical protein
MASHPRAASSAELIGVSLIANNNKPGKKEKKATWTL